MTTILRNSPPVSREAPNDEFAGLREELVKMRRDLEPGLGRTRSPASPALAAIEAALADIAALTARPPRSN